MKYNKYLTYFFRVVFLGFIISNSIIYVLYSKIKSASKPIVYSFIETTYHSGRGGSYEMKVEYLRNEYEVSITRRDVKDIGLNKKPELYFSDLNDNVFSLWEIKRALRIALVFLFLFLVTFIPAKFYQLDVRN